MFKATLVDLEQQAAGYAAAQLGPVTGKIDELMTDLDQVASKLASFVDKAIDDTSFTADLNALPGAINTARTRLAELKTAANAQVAGVSVPSGIRQSILNAVQKLDDFLADLAAIEQVISSGKTLFTTLDDVIGDPSTFEALFSDPNALAAKLSLINDAIPGFRSALQGFHLLDGAPKTIVLDALATVHDVLGDITAILNLIAMLTGDTLTIRFDWNPEISSWGFDGGSASANPIFVANDKKGFMVAVEAKVKKNGSSGPKISVTCGLKHFDLVLIAPASFMELNFEKIEFSIDSAAKMNVDVLLTDIKFVGPLSFVETLRDLIPLDGFSDPPYLDISTSGIDAGFDVSLPSISVGVLNLSNLSLGAGFTVPFIGQPLSVRFNFCTREQPFLLTVWVFGGGGFFGVTIDPHGVQILEASFEFGAAISIDLGVASGGVHVMAGIYFRMEQDAASLTGYFRLGGHVSVLGIITASLELYLELHYEFQSGKCTGKASLTIEISLFIFSGSVTVSCERKFAGSNGDPSLRQMLGFHPELSLDQELALIDSEAVDYAWRDHIEAFA